MEINWLSGSTNILNIEIKENTLSVELIHENEECQKSFQIDKVNIPLKYLTDEYSSIVLDQLISNDLKNVGYKYVENYRDIKQNETIKTMYNKQVKGTLNIITNSLDKKYA